MLVLNFIVIKRFNCLSNEYPRDYFRKLLDDQNLMIEKWFFFSPADTGSCAPVVDISKLIFFSSPDPKVSYCHHWSSVVRPSVNFSHFNQLLWSHCANLNQTLVEWSLNGPLPKMCPVIPTSNQHDRQAKNRKKEGWNFNCPLLL